MKRKANKGFTLLELLVVIVIIAIVAAMLFPVIARAKRSAKATVDISNMRQLYYAVTLYENDNGDRPPALLPLVYPYVKTQQIYASPLDPREPDTVLGDWTPAPCGPLGYSPRVNYMVSYPYLKSFLPDDEWTLDRYHQEMRNNPKIGMLASPWVGEVTGWDHEIVSGEDLANSHGPHMKGGIFRIKMDGSLYKLQQRRMEDCLGACREDLFFFEN